jgi:hypothetical protein
VISILQTGRQSTVRRVGKLRAMLDWLLSSLNLSTAS